MCRRRVPREASKLTLLHVVAAVPCVLLLTLGVPMQSTDGAAQHTSFVIEAMQAMPRFGAWMRAAFAMLGADVEALSQRSPQYRHYRENLSRKELGSLHMAGTGFGPAGLASMLGGAPSKPAKMPSWPYSNLGSLGSRESVFTKELPFDEYRRRGEGEDSGEFWQGGRGRGCAERRERLGSLRSLVDPTEIFSGLSAVDRRASSLTRYPATRVYNTRRYRPGG